MYMFNPRQCPWPGPAPDMFNGPIFGNHGYRQVFPNGGRFPGPLRQQFPGGPPFRPQGMYPPPWQGPGPSRQRNRGYRSNRGSGVRGNNRQRSLQAVQDNLPRDICCKCGERLQNSDEHGVHLCDGGNEVIFNEENDGQRDTENKENEEEETTEEPESLDARLEKLLENLKDFMRNKYQTVTEALEEYVTGKIEEINTIHRENFEEKERLEKIKSELEEKASVLEKQEKELRDKQRRLAKDQDSFKRESKKEKEEICRQWQQLRDEISRMEEVHESQEGRIRLDVGGQLFTTSRLTLTREADSMLAAMFSGRHDIKFEDGGAVFIDRDGTHFRYVLNYLRDGGLTMDCLPKDRQLLKELRKEATYYQLHGLLQQTLLNNKGMYH